MATIDLSRDALQLLKHYSGVRMQQGRVLTDDDFNEAAALEAEAARKALIDVVGPYGSPDDGFKVGSPPSLSGGFVDLTLTAGTLYVGGLRVELEADVDLSAQADFLLQRDADRARDATSNGDLVYLEVWQQPVSAVEDAELFEAALGGPDTTQRLRTMARVRMTGVNDTSCAGAWSELTTQLQSAGRGTWDPETAALRNDLRLIVDYNDSGDEEDLCAPDIAEGYLGARNAALRLQLVDPAGTGATAAFTWSYSNAAPLYRVSVNTSLAPARTTITFLTEPKDQAHWPLAEQQVELVPLSAILDSNRELVGEGHGRCEEQLGGELLSAGHGHLAPVVTGYDPTSRTIVLDGHPPSGFNTLATTLAGAALDDEGNPRDFECYLRLWDRGTDLVSDTRIGITPGGSAVPLGNTGITVRLTGNDVGADAHWIIAARPHTPSQVVPWDLQSAEGRAPHGVTTYLCPLAVIDWSGTPVVHDCRETFRPLTRLKTCCTLTVGNGEISHGDYTSIQQAIDELPEEGGEVCVLPGIYTDPIAIQGRHDIILRGCGDRSQIYVQAGDTTPAVWVEDCQRITLRGLSIQAPEFWCVQVSETNGATTNGILIDDATLRARDYGAVTFDAGSELMLKDSRLIAEPLTQDPEPGLAAGRLPLIWSQGEQVRIVGNSLFAEEGESPMRQGAGGIRVAGNSLQVEIVDNRISGGNGVGISLGSVVSEEDTGNNPGWYFGYGFFYTYWADGCLHVGYIPGGWYDPTGTTVLISDGIVEEVEIRRNRIENMAADGIAAAWFFDDEDGDGTPDDTILVDRLQITDNLIRNCCRGEFVEISDYLTQHVSHGGISLADVNRLHIARNEIRDNGAGRDVALAAISTWLVSGVIIEQVQAENNGSISALPLHELIGGIILRAVIPAFGDDLDWRGGDSLVLRDNTISAPQGRPLAAAVFGPASVQSNVLTSLRVREDTNFNGIGTGIMLLNLGGWTENFDSQDALPPNGGYSGLIHFVDNQVTTGGGAASNNGLLLFQHLLASFDSVTANSNVFRSDNEQGYIIVDVWGFARAVQGSLNRIVEVPGHTLLSMLWWGTFAAELNANMATHCFLRIDPVEGNDEGQANRSMYDTWAISHNINILCSSVFGDPSGAKFGVTNDNSHLIAADKAVVKVARYQIYDTNRNI